MGTPHPLQGLREIRRARRITIADMAELLNIAPTSYSRFESGTRRAYFDKVVTIAERLGVRTDDLTLLLDEQDALRICDQRDKEAIAAGTFNRALWTPGASASVPPPPEPAPEPAPEPEQIAAVPPPPPPLIESGNADEDVSAIMEGWDEQ